MPQRLQRLNQLILASFAAIALALLFWSVLRGDSLLRRDDNPRLVEAELRIRRGAIVDRNGTVLAVNEGTPERQLRRYPLPGMEPAIGYYSLRFGTSGVEQSFDTVLRGNPSSPLLAWEQRLLHRPQVGAGVQLTIDAGWQQTAVSQFRDQTGALVLLELNGDAPAQIRALVSQPGYDPNLLDEQFDALVADATAPLLNRATQGQYQPGLLLQPFIVAAAAASNELQLNATVDNPNRPVPIGSVVTRCSSRPPEPATWADVVTHHCPAPLRDLGDRLGAARLDQIFADFGLTTPPLLPLVTETAVSKPTSDPVLAAIGQEHLTVTPLQLAVALAALGNNGRLPTLQLVTATGSDAAGWEGTVVEGEGKTAVSPATARAVAQALPQSNDSLNFSRLVLSGPEASNNSWYLALAPANQPRYALVIVVENSDDRSTAAAIGQALLQEVISDQ